MKRLMACCAVGFLLASCNAGKPQDTADPRKDAPETAVDLSLPTDALPAETPYESEVFREPDRTRSADLTTPSRAHEIHLGPKPAWWPKTATEVRPWRWESGDYETRRVYLNDLARRGSEWASETLRKLENGEMQPEELDDFTDKFAEESIAHPFVIETISRGRDDNGCAPMPFGSSMFGPWSTGGGTTDP